MIAGLSIRDVVLIERLDLSFGKGLSGLTGETGAGKSILLDALGLALGARAESGLVRHGAAQATVAASFAPPDGHPVEAVLGELGIAQEDDLVLRRTLSADGRSRAFVNDQPVSVGALRRIGDLLVEVQGQFEQRGLLDPATHLETLDAFGRLGALPADAFVGEGSEDANAALEAVGSILERHKVLQERLWPSINSPAVAALYQAVAPHATGSHICGAGNGGHIVVFM